MSVTASLSRRAVRWRVVARRAVDGVLPPMVERRAAVAGGGLWRPDAPEAYCPRCGASAGPGTVLAAGCVRCRGIKRLGWARLVRLSAYGPPMDQWVRAMKYQGQWRRAAELGRLLGPRVPEPIGGGPVVVAAAPMHWSRRWWRGYNQAELMARELGRARGWPAARLLRRTRHTHPQTAVAPSQRASNAAGSIAAEPIDLTGWHVVLVDDVKTTGATLSACARALRGQGAAGVYAAVAAVADPRGQDFRTI